MPNHRIYKPSVYQKSLEVGTREKSQRSRKKTERYENTLKPNPEALKRLTRWTAKELSILVSIYFARFDENIMSFTNFLSFRMINFNYMDHLT